MSTNFKKNILLTGAGFTANFGAPLSKEMWSKILNNPKIENLPEVRKLLMSNFDFEQIYSDVLRMRDFSDEQKELFQKIIIEAYSDMDETLKTYVYGGFNQYGSFWSNVSRFLGLFAGSRGEVGAHFTLNQDLLLERAIQRHPLGMAAAEPQYRGYWDSITSNGLDPSALINLPTEEVLADFKTKHLSSVGEMFYVKMHGSHGWLSSTGKNQMG